MKTKISFYFLATLLALGTGLAAGRSKPNPHHILSAKTVNRPDALETFVRTGLNLQIQKVEINAPNVYITFRISDSAGQGLDRQGIDTAGPINIGYTFARIKPGDQQYTSYYSAPPGGITQPKDFTDQGGSYQSLGDGVYRYTMGLRLPANYEVNATHTLGMWASRNLEDFGLGVPNANAVYTFVPSGAPVTQVRDIVSTAACNQCHDPLAAHGLPPFEFDRRDVRICILCHYAGQINPETGNTIDERVFIHKLHMGADLPSVTNKPLSVLGISGSSASVATGATQLPIAAGYDPSTLPGKPYQIVVTSEAETFDASTLVFPQDVRNCTTCHQKATQADNWKTNPSRAACGSCHDNVDFTTGKNHAGLVQTDDTKCTGCHFSSMGTEFDLSIPGAHTMPTKSKQLAGLNVSITGVANATAGGNPQVTFTVTDNGGNAVDASKLDRLFLTVAGPTTDYTTAPPWQEDARQATPGPNGYTYTLKRSLPADASGTWAVGAEAFRNLSISGPIFAASFPVRETAFNPVYYFAIGGGDVVPRRQVVDVNKCNVCHDQIRTHGGARRNTEYCVMCHNPKQVDGQDVPETVNFRTMIHRIHMGVALDNTYNAGGQPGENHQNWNGVRYPADPRDCSKCHVGTTYTLPLPDGLVATDAPAFFYSPVQPAASACLGCHNGQDAAAHASLMTASLGESCDVCHGEDAAFAVTKVHARNTVWPPEDAN